MTKDELIDRLQKSTLPGDAVVRFSCDAIVDGDLDQLVGDVTGVIEHHDRLIIEGDGVDPEDRAEWEQKWDADSDA